MAFKSPLLTRSVLQKSARRLLSLGAGQGKVIYLCTSGKLICASKQFSLMRMLPHCWPLRQHCLKAETQQQNHLSNKKNQKKPNNHCINANGSYLKKAPDYPFQAIIHWWTKGPGLMMFVCSWWGWWGWWCAPQLRVLKYSAKKKQRDSNYSPDIIKTFTSRHWSIS